MSTILTIYSNSAFKRFLLPVINDADYSILLSETLFNLPENIELRLEVADNFWYFIPAENYEIRYLTDSRDCYSSPLKSEDDPQKNEYRLLIDGKHVLSIIVGETNNCFSIYDHFDISSVQIPITIGRSTKNVICFDYRDRHLVSGEHAVIFKSGSKVIFQDLNSANGCYVNNRRIEGSIGLSFGDCIDIFGLRIVYLGDIIAVNVAESAAAIDYRVLNRKTVVALNLEKKNTHSLTTILHRSPRRVSRIETGEIKIDEPPASKEEAKKQGILAALGSALSMSLPMLLGCMFMIYASQVSGFSRGLFLYVGLVTAISSAVIGTVRSVIGMRRAVAEYERYEKLRNEKYGAYLKEQENIIKDKYERNTFALRDRYASAKECSEYTSKQPLLWSRNFKQPDFLSYRLGIGNLPFQVDIHIPDKKFSMTENNLLEIPANIKKSYEELRDVPVCVDLLKEKLVGIIGGRRMTGGIQVVRNLLIQIAANNCYTDVKIALVYDKKKVGLDYSWDYVRWFPHVWNETKSFRYIASDKEEASDVFYELNKIIRQRIDDESPRLEKEEAIPRPYYILIIASPEFLDGELISQYILEPKNSYGFTTIYMTERYEQLPNKCEFIVENDDTYSGIYNISDDYEDRINVRFDQSVTEDAERLATNISSIEVQELETGGDIPNSITFFEMYGIKKPNELDVINRWRKNRTYDSMKALIGQKAGGAPCFLDIHEKYHGPHGLVAGTTGSGKSETLQTYILSLAINFSPDDVGFFVIDYKGGGMANLFTDLPHMIGQISNLSGNKINRALLSIQSEKDRREALFAKYGVKDIRDYTKLYKNHEASVPLPHLIMVIDEFAEMKKEEPEFIQEIISVSRVGRSLGIHLIMATQKPAGSVSDDIWANSRFKLCLRVQSKQDSVDMLHKPDAAYLTQSGRCYLQVGNDELYELFQSGYSGAIYDADDVSVSTNIARLLNTDGVPAVEGNHALIIRKKERKIKWIDDLLSLIREICGDDKESINVSRESQEFIVSKVFKKLRDSSVDYPETEHNRENMITLLEQIGKIGFDACKIVDSEEYFTNAKKKLPTQPERTQLETIVGYLKEVAEENGYNHDFSLFMPLLPECITLKDLSNYSNSWNTDDWFDGASWKGNSEKRSREIAVGVYDDPVNQRQDIYTLNFTRTGNIVLFGSASTGKTTYLQTLVFGLLNRYSPSEVNIYMMDFSAGKLSCFENAPHVGSIIRENDDSERIDKFFIMMSRLLVDRKRCLNGIAFEQYIKNEDSESIASIFIVIDNFAGLLNRVGDKYHSLLNKLAKEGISNGIYLLVTASGVSSNEFPNSLAQSFRTTVCLELNNSYDYSNFMRSTRLRTQPETGIKGRGITYINDHILEFQTAIPLSRDNEIETWREIDSLCRRMNAAWEGESAMPIMEIPENPTWKEYIKRKDVNKMFDDDRMLPIGYDAKYADGAGLDLSNLYTVLLTGAKKKGKTNALKALMYSAYRKGGKIVIVDFEKEFVGIASEMNAVIIQDELKWAEYLSELLKEEVAPRNALKGELLDEGASEIEIYTAMQRYEKIFIFIDDLPEFVDRIIHPKMKEIPQNLLANMEMIIDKGALHNLFWIVTIDKDTINTVSSSNLYKLFTREKKGLHFGGMVHATALSGMNFENHDRKTLDSSRLPGQAMIPADNESETLEVVVPIVRGKQL